MRRVVVTGLGLLTPLANDAEGTWAALLEGRSGIGPITHFDTTDFATKIAGEVKGFDPTKWIEPREAKHLDPFVQFGLAAADMAVADAGLDKAMISAEADRVGVYVGSGLGGVTSIERTHKALVEKGPRRGMSPYFVPMIIVNITPGHISIRTGARGPNMSHVSACSTGAHSIGEAQRTILRGDADVMIAGGCEATITPLGVGGFNAMRALSTRNDEPLRASRPFDIGRDGFVMAEGAGIVVIEELEHARRRSARIYAELAGYGLTSDAHHITSPPDSGEGAVRCMRMAISDGKVALDRIGYINAHGTSTKQGDVAETRAVHRVFGDHARRLAISSTKSMTGHLLGAGGGVEAAIAVLSILRGVLPPTINLDQPDPACDLDYVPNVAREVTIDAALSNSFGFGGTNATLLFTRYA
ncbi:MAG: beta-ketoacyl-[acyl-carrier-protein] synthase II [Myxococcales bacterium]|nr:beta-ketoacyl-[acyl-carrier-protein] synthase II [Myxococcales bacterium]